LVFGHAHRRRILETEPPRLKSRQTVTARDDPREIHSSRDITMAHNQTWIITNRNAVASLSAGQSLPIVQLMCGRQTRRWAKRWDGDIVLIVLGAIVLFKGVTVVGVLTRRRNFTANQLFWR
jgi:hypothetical protein